MKVGKVAVPPAKTARGSGVAAVLGGNITDGVIKAGTVRPRMSVTTYFTGDAVPLNVGNGSNVTTPVVVFTVYVPSPATVNDVNVQLAFAVDVVAHKRTVLASKVAGVVALSFVNGEIV